MCNNPARKTSSKSLYANKMEITVPTVTMITSTMMTLTVMVYTNRVGAVNEVKLCNSALGMESGLVADEQLTASSSFDDFIVGPQNSRIRSERQGGAWCPKEPISQHSYEWLQVDLRLAHVITSIELQGRFAAGQGKEYAEWINIQFRRHNNSDWVAYPHTIAGNDNTYIPIKRKFLRHMIASQIRIVPVSKLSRTVCLRFEVYGCIWRNDNKLLHYNMPRGNTYSVSSTSSSLPSPSSPSPSSSSSSSSASASSSSSPSAHDLNDITYDGTITKEIMLGGLGLLVDGDYGDYYNDEGTILEGYVGWSRNENGMKNVWIEFAFEQIRSFQEVAITAFHDSRKNQIKQPGKIEIYFAFSDGNYSSNTISHDVQDDLPGDHKSTNKIIAIQLNDRIAKYLKLIFYFNSDWIALSEVEFKTNATNQTADPEFDIQTPSSQRSSLPTTKLLQLISSNLPLFVLIFSTSLLSLFCILLITTIILCRSRRKIRKISATTQNGSTLTSKVDREIESINGRCPKEWDNMSPKSIGSWFTRSEVGDRSVKCSQDCSDILKSPRSQMRNQSIYEETAHSIQARKLPMPPSVMEWSGFYNGSHKYIKPRKSSNHTPSETPSTTSCTMISNHSPSPYPLKKFYPTILYHDRLHKVDYFDPVIYRDYLVKRNSFKTLSNDQNYSANICCENVPQNHFNHLSKPQCHCSFELHNNANNLATNSPKDRTWRHLPREKLVYLREIGEGPFGKICLCELMPVTKHAFTSKREKVIVKLLKEENYPEIKSYFFEEIKLMNRLKHKNIASLVGICVDEFPYCIATEYLTNGDLKRFLQHYEVIHPDTCDPERNTISSNVLSFFSYQISCGMEYLESLNLVHRDLATRNCLVGERGHVKISDFGMSKCLHSSDYYQIQGIAVLPIRWMAWESLFLGKFSTASDVWSFGVTLWEVMTLAKHQPFDELTDEQVIENSQRCFYENLKLSNRPNQEEHLVDNSCACTCARDREENITDEIQKDCNENQSDHNKSTTVLDSQSLFVSKTHDENSGTSSPLDAHCMDDFQLFLLAQPLNCPSKFYNLMLSCWSTDPASRPRFLQLKNTLRSTFDVDLVTRDVTLLDEFTSSKMRNECFSLDNRKRTIISNSTLSSPVFD